MEIFFFAIAFIFLFWFEKSRRVPATQWSEALPEHHENWEQYDIPTFQRRGIEIAKQKALAVKKSPRNKSRGKANINTEITEI